jgi:ATP-dependent DNA helicase RecQ
VLVQELLRLKQLDNSLEWSNCAVLTTEWRLLNPVRAMLESEKVPLSLALPKQSQPPPFRIRENLALLNAIKQSTVSLCKASEWLDCLRDTQADEPTIWQQQLQRLLQNWQIETDNAEVSKQQLLEYLYETLAEQRRDNRLGQGVFLSTIHSVKGMEFSHVFILDGAWTVPATEEQRRLFYVAMTRAKETLSLLQRQDQANPYLKSLVGDFVVHRNSEDYSIPGIPLERTKYSVLGLKDFDLSYAGSFAKNNSIHQVLASLNVGEIVTLNPHDAKIVVQHNGLTIAILSKTAQQQWQPILNKVQSATIIAMITRYKTDSEEHYQTRCKIEQWEVPMLEVRVAF